MKCHRCNSEDLVLSEGVGKEKRYTCRDCVGYDR